MLSLYLKRNFFVKRDAEPISTLIRDLVVIRCYARRVARGSNSIPLLIPLSFQLNCGMIEDDRRHVPSHSPGTTGMIIHIRGPL